MHNTYWECEQKCRKLTKTLNHYVFLHTAMFPTVLAYAIVCIAFGNYDTSTWYLPMAMLLPFDRTHIFGWLMAWFIQLAMVTFYGLCMPAVTSYFISCCYYIDAMCVHFNVLIDSITKNVERMQSEKNLRKIEKIREQTIAQLCNLVTFHIEIYE